MNKPTPSCNTQHAYAMALRHIEETKDGMPVSLQLALMLRDSLEEAYGKAQLLKSSKL